MGHESDLDYAKSIVDRLLHATDIGRFFESKILSMHTSFMVTQRNAHSGIYNPEAMGRISNRYFNRFNVRPNHQTQRLVWSMLINQFWDEPDDQPEYLTYKGYQDPTETTNPTKENIMSTETKYYVDGQDVDRISEGLLVDKANTKSGVIKVNIENIAELRSQIVKFQKSNAELKQDIVVIKGHIRDKQNA